MNTETEIEPRRVAGVYHDGDGLVYPYDQHEEHMEEWPENWPQYIADVPTFCRARNLWYKR